VSIQKIYKSRMPLVSFTCFSFSLAMSFSLANDAGAKQIVGPVEKIQPLITLSQVQTMGSPLVPVNTFSTVKPKPASAQRSSNSARAKKRISPDHYRLGMALKAKGDNIRALVEFLKATQKNPRQINAFYEQALIFRQQGYLKLADSSLEQALRIAKTSKKNPVSKSSSTKIFNENDLTRIRLLLASLRLEQGNIGSAAEELSRSLGITVTLPQKDKAPIDTAVQEEQNAPTTILQLHPKIEEVADKTVQQIKPRKVQHISEDDLWSEPADIEKPEKETPADATVAALLKEGIAGLKDHVFNPLSILGIPHFSLDSAQTEKTEHAKKEKQPRLSFWNEAKKRAAEKREQLARERKLAAEKRRADRERIAEEKRVAQEQRIADARTLAQEKKLAAEQKLAELERLRAEKKLAREKRIAEKAGSSKEKIAVADSEPKDKEPAGNSEVKESTDLVASEKTPADISIAQKDPSPETPASQSAVEPESAEASSFSLAMPPAITKKISLVDALLSAFNHEEKASRKDKEPEKPVDPVEARLKYLAEHGTASLKEGEAFMFSEESGEATLFMGNGEVIRRTIAIARGHEEVAKLRRPDILIPEELIYNLALMAKILPKQDATKESEISVEPKETAPTLKMPAILDKPRTFTDWIRDVLNL